MTAIASSADLVARLQQLYAEQLELTPEDPYTIQHARLSVIETQVAVFQWYRKYLKNRSVHFLDWGCRHAPDSCLLRATFGHGISLHAADIEESNQFTAFHQYAGLEYSRLNHVYRLPYPDESFDTVIGSGTLEHVAMDFESLKEIYRVLRVGGRFVMTYLPNERSYEEWWKRNIRKVGAHPRVYSRNELRYLLVHHGFRLIADGYQTRSDLLGGAVWWKRLFVRGFQLHRFSSTLCAVAEKVKYING
jgi:SAM-dependent methyltransferase